MTKEQEQAIKSMQNFVNSTIDTTVVTAKEMSTILNLIQQLQEEKEKYKQLYNKALGDLVKKAEK